MRGDDHRWCSSSRSRGGSPPHARGRPVAVRVGRAADGLTPACAGTTRWRRSRGRPNRAHPRMRGDDVAESDAITVAEGSPPHARGRRPTPCANTPTVRLTPACAGTTTSPQASQIAAWAHPRMRGDDPAHRHPRGRRAGSPPHARGRPPRPRPTSPPPRLTPACAGTTPTSPAATRRSRAHPRMRGDDSPQRSARTSFRGSPPHARGRQGRGCGTGARPWAHPRMRGDDTHTAMARSG